MNTPALPVMPLRGLELAFRNLCLEVSRLCLCLVCPSICCCELAHQMVDHIATPSANTRESGSHKLGITWIQLRGNGL
jgi:hypothetical protein